MLVFIFFSYVVVENRGFRPKPVHLINGFKRVVLNLVWVWQINWPTCLFYGTLFPMDSGIGGGGGSGSGSGSGSSSGSDGWKIWSVKMFIGGSESGFFLKKKFTLHLSVYISHATCWEGTGHKIHRCETKKCFIFNCEHLFENVCLTFVYFLSDSFCAHRHFGVYIYVHLQLQPCMHLHSQIEVTVYLKKWRERWEGKVVKVLYFLCSSFFCVNVYWNFQFTSNFVRQTPTHCLGTEKKKENSRGQNCYVCLCCYCCLQLIKNLIQVSPTWYKKLKKNWNQIIVLG